MSNGGSSTPIPSQTCPGSASSHRTSRAPRVSLARLSKMGQAVQIQAQAPIQQNNTDQAAMTRAAAASSTARCPRRGPPQADSGASQRTQPLPLRPRLRPRRNHRLPAPAQVQPNPARFDIESTSSRLSLDLVLVPAPAKVVVALKHSQGSNGFVGTRVTTEVNPPGTNPILNLAVTQICSTSTITQYDSSVVSRSGSR